MDLYFQETFNIIIIRQHQRQFMHALWQCTILIEKNDDRAYLSRFIGWSKNTPQARRIRRCTFIIISTSSHCHPLIKPLIMSFDVPACLPACRAIYSPEHASRIALGACRVFLRDIHSFVRSLARSLACLLPRLNVLEAPVSQLIGPTKDQVVPPMPPRWEDRHV